jgi:hypothetical protein
MHDMRVIFVRILAGWQAYSYGEMEGPVTTTTTSWAPVPALSGLSGGCNVDGISVAVTVNLTGKPVQLRAVNGPNILNTSSVTFRPPAGSGVETFSASFAGGQETGNTPLTT